MLSGFKFIWKNPANEGCRVNMLCEWVKANVRRRLLHTVKTLPLFGFEFVAYPDCSVGYVVSFTRDGLFDYDWMNFFRRFVGPDDTCLDIGANVGAYTLLFASLAPNGRVIAVEPGPTSFPRLEENVQRNKLTGRVDLVNKALGEESGVLEFVVGKQSSSSHIVRDRDDQQRVTGVACTTLDDLGKTLDIGRCDFAKVDVEGFEESVILGGCKFLHNMRPKGILIEANGLSLNYGSDLTQAYERMAAMGYRWGTYDHQANLLTVFNNFPGTVSPENNYLALSEQFLEDVVPDCTLNFQ